MHPSLLRGRTPWLVVFFTGFTGFTGIAGIAVSAVLAAGLGPLLPAPAFAVGVAQETVVPATLRGTYTSATLLSPSTHGGHDGAGARTKLFTAWGGSYDAVVGVGDITGDGKADLVERDSAGNLFRNGGDGKGSFGARVKISGGWSGCKGVF